MSREIKFRGKHVDNGEWVYGYFVGYSNAMGYIYGDYIEKDEVFQVDPSTISQYTGLKDKNGTEIYEGDIVKWWGYEVQFGRQLRPERIICINDYIKDAYKILCITEDTGQTVEVIGNIYEDKHLLEVEQCGI